MTIIAHDGKCACEIFVDLEKAFDTDMLLEKQITMVLEAPHIICSHLINVINLCQWFQL